ncbi:DNA-binding domain-containing protein, partial [Vibrio lentus]
MTNWFTTKELVGLPGLPEHSQNISRMAKKNGWEFRQKEGVKGVAYEFSMNSLPIQTQTALMKKQGKVQVGDQVLELPKKKSEQSYCREALWARWSKNNNAAKEKAQQALRTVQAVFALKNNGIKLMDAYQSVSEEYGVALSTLRRSCAKVKGIDECDWAPALLPKNFESSQTQKPNQFAYVTPEAWEFFKADYLSLEQPAMSVCYERLIDTAPSKGWKVPSLKSLGRRLEHEVPVQQRIMLREGEHALHQMFPPQERTVEGLHALEWINGDGYQHNVFVKWFNGEILRPKTWFWQDIYSRKIIGWRCDISENTDSIR